MRHVFRFILLLFVLAPFALAAAVWFALSPRPAVVAQALSSQEVEFAQRFLERNDPRGSAPGTAHSVRATEQELNLALNYLAQKFARGSARVTIVPGALNFTGTMNVPGLTSRPYLNLIVRLEEAGGQLRLSEVHVGSVPVPAFIAVWAFEEASESTYPLREYKLASTMLQQVELQPGAANIRYLWQPDTVRALGAQLAGTDSATLAVYHNHLLVLQSNGAARSGSVTELLKSMFTLAQARSAQSDPMAENRALLMILGAWASERDMNKLVPMAQAKPAPFKMSLQRRQDFGQHFLVSAAIASAGDSALANAIGIQKEVSDSRGGSGFSFTDIAADRAGTRFGKLATASAESARRVQALLGKGVSEPDIMPPALDLPEGMNEAEFQRRYISVGSPAYQQMLEEIDRRINACTLYRG